MTYDWSRELDLDGIAPDVLQGTRVSRFMENGESGRWRLRHFSISDKDYTRKLLEIDVSSSDERMKVIEKRRAVPPGDYITLQRRMTEEEIDQVIHANDLDELPREQVIERFLPPDQRYIAIMSDTPTEIVEQADALRFAEGRVLITGLGLACIPFGLLEKPEVTHIDIIEIDPEVIALTARYLADDPRVTVHQGSAIDPDAIFGPDVEWDYAWHDIWSQISEDNLDDATAEHGISYERVFDLYAHRVGDQGAWALAEAVEKASVEQASRETELEFIRSVRGAPLDEQVELLYDKVIRGKVVGWPKDAPITDDILSILDPEGEFKAHLRQRLQESDFWPVLERRIAEPDTSPRAQSFPNAHLT